MNNILVTGGSGFLGKNLVPYLQRKQKKVVLLTRDELIGITNKTIDNNYTAIVHLAGKAHDLKKTANPAEYYQVNYELTKKLYDAFLQSTAQKFIFISSVKAVADVVDGVLTEDVPAHPQTDYGKSKLMAEQYIQNQPLPAGKAYYILRPCMIHGPGNKGNLNLLYQFVKKGIPYPLAAFENKRSFLSVENLCFVIAELIDSNNAMGGVYQVADDEALSTNELIGYINDASNKKGALWHVPPVLVKGLAKIGDWFKLPLNTERLHKLIENYVVDNCKIKNALQKELPVVTRDGIITTIKSFQ